MPSSPSLVPPQDGVDFSSLPWNLNLPESHLYIHLRTTTGEWTDEHYNASTDQGSLFDSVYSYKDKPLDTTPATTSLNYGTTIWEGLKCYRASDDQAFVFRADQNYERMKHGASEMCLPMPSKALFMRSIQLAIQRNAHLIPPCGDGMKLYVRPMLLGTGQQLGLYPSPEFSFVVYVSPTGNYFKASTAGLNLHLETRRARAARGGMGAVKCSGNYAIALKPLMDCKKQGFHDNIFLELETYNGNLKEAILQELSAANIFLVLNTGEIVTPSLDRGTILPGVTRRSVLTLIETYADELSDAVKKSTGNDEAVVKASSRDVSVAELENASEVFCTGTAAELVPIARIATGTGEDVFDRKFPHGSALPGGPVAAMLLTMLREVMVGKRTDPALEGWIKDPFASPSDFCK